jgi:hypothetical protein
MLKILDATVQNLVSQDLCTPDLEALFQTVFDKVTKSVKESLTVHGDTCDEIRFARIYLYLK